MDESHLADWFKKRKERRSQLDPEEMLKGLLGQNNTVLSTAITLLESTRKDDRQKANELVRLCIPHAGKSIRIGITGVPGVGKSTFIESFGKVLLKAGKKIAVLAIDPSSEFSGGSILGDKTRMQDLSQTENVFIRPSPAGKTLGGVARKTRESILLCEAAGYDLILIETVGVGQSETMVHSMVDFFLLLMLAGAGDELQGIKRGIMEMADLLVITKADGDNAKKANVASQEYRNAMHLFPPNPSQWVAKSFTCSSVTGNNIEHVFETIEEFEVKTKTNGWFKQNRLNQDKFWLHEALKELLFDGFFANEDMENKLKKSEEALSKGEITSFQGAEELYQAYLKNTNGREV
jgi:LAO/AO transport system kinase